MKRLVIIRHGKSSWELNVRDFDRALTQRGVDDAHKMGEHLADAGIKIDTVWSSPAARALQTCIIVTEHLNKPLEQILLKKELYTFNKNSLLNTIYGCTDVTNTLLLFSHNPGITELVNQLGTEHFDNVPTTGMVVIEFSQKTWAEISHGTTIFHTTPKQL